MILSLCSNPDILRIFHLIKIIMTAIQIAVPIILIFTVTMDFAKGTANATAPGDILKTCKVRIIAACLIFFVPLFFSVVLKIAGDSTDVSMCWNNANSTYIKYAQQKYDEEEQKRIEEEKKRQEEEQKKQEEQKEKDELSKNYNDTNSHKNSINGIRYKLYDQADPRWGKTKYENGKTIAEIGCLITSMAVISSAADHNVTPQYIFDKKANNYYMTNAIPKVAGKDNFKCVVGSITKEQIVKDLSSGKVGIIMVKADSVFTAYQHYMALIDISSDGEKIFIGNSYGGGKGSYNRTGWFPRRTVLTDVHEYVICTPSQQLIDKFK